MTDKLTVYTHPECSYSSALKAELADLGVQFDEIDLSERPSEWDTLEKLTGGDRITPVSVEGDIITIDFHGVGWTY